MPAINLARLKIQAVRLSEKFNQPEAFIHDLNELLDFYTNRTIRATQIATRFSLPTYSTPAPVLRHIQAELVPLIENHPFEAFVLTDALWEAGSLESRLLAASLLGNIPLAQTMTTLENMPDRLAQSTDKEVRTALLTEGFARLRREDPEAFLFLLEEWLESPRNPLRVWGLQALIPMLTDPLFENLPTVFRILRPAIRSAGPGTQLELRDCLAALENVSPIETLAYLRETIRDNPPVLMLRTLQRILPGLPHDLHLGLKEMLRQQGGKGKE
jgi:hypothetical protein